MTMPWHATSKREIAHAERMAQQATSAPPNKGVSGQSGSATRVERKQARKSAHSEPGVLEVTLDDLPPSLNNLYATVEVKGRSRRILSSAACAWKRDAALLIRSAAQQQEWTVERRAPLFVNDYYWPIYDSRAANTMLMLDTYDIMSLQHQGTARYFDDAGNLSYTRFTPVSAAVPWCCNRYSMSKRAFGVFGGTRYDSPFE